jgi:hypothetical protein
MNNVIAGTFAGMNIFHSDEIQNSINYSQF